MATQYSIEESLERATIAALEAVAALDDCRIVSADESSEDDLPQITVRAEKLDEVVLGMQTWNLRLIVRLTAPADLTPTAELATETDPDDGAAGFKNLWKSLTDTLDASGFIDSLNASELVKVWGLEFEPVTYENETRSFSRSAGLRVWCNEAYPTPTP
jgi:hypothetical protein